MASYIIETKENKWEVVCGLEIHCQVVSKSKVFSCASTRYGDEPNKNVDFLDVGMPGTLPILNEEIVKQAVKTGIGLNATINKYSAFARKNYFYADLPLGYQITQDKFPIVGEGFVEVKLEDCSKSVIGIERMHIEQDTGKSLHDISPDKSLIDFNRAGVALMEIVTKPDFRHPEEAGAFLRKLRLILRYLETCDGNMDEGSMRCDVNVSVRKLGESEYRTRTEMKNVNSIRFVMQAIESEAKRQVGLYENGEMVCQETRQFDPISGDSRMMRKKEFAHDYRYFPEPDLLPLVLSDDFIQTIKNQTPELPDVKKNRFIKDLGLPEYDARVICDNKETAKFFEIAIKDSDAKKVANWIMGDLFALLKKEGLDVFQSKIKPEYIGELVNLINTDVISSKIAKDVFEIMFETGQTPAKIVEEKGWKQVTDTGFIDEVIDSLIASNPDNVLAYKNGRNNLLGWFVGQVMKQTCGKSNPAIISQMISDKLT